MLQQDIAAVAPSGLSVADGYEALVGKAQKIMYSRALGFFSVPPVLWSQGIGHFCDFAGPDWYRCAPTESTRPQTWLEPLRQERRQAAASPGHV
ncbi:hypothetical protein ACVDG5_030290 [Mesorhizobium sp. ORM6]